MPLSTGLFAFVSAFVSTAIVARTWPTWPKEPKRKSKDDIIEELEGRVDMLRSVNKALHDQIRLERARFDDQTRVLRMQRDMAAAQARDVLLAQYNPPPIPMQPPSQAQQDLAVRSIEAMLNHRSEDPGHFAFCTCVPARGDAFRRRAF
jgi:hypothetical protein